MKPQHITQWAALLGMITGMAAIPMSATAAQNPAVNTDLVTGGTYYTVSNDYNSAKAVRITSGSFNGVGNFLYTSGSYGSAIFVTGSGDSFTGSNITAYVGLKLDADGNALDAKGEITTDPSAFVSSGAFYNAAVRAELGGKIHLDGITIVNLSNGAGANGYGLNVATGSEIFARAVDITVAYGGALLAEDNSILTVDGGRVHNTGNILASVSSGRNSQATISNMHIISDAAAGLEAAANSSLTINNSLVENTGTQTALHVTNAKLTVNGGAVTTNGGNLLLIGGTGNSQVNLRDADTAAAGGINSAASGTGAVNVNGGSGINGDLTNSASGTLTVNFNNSTVTGDVINAGDGVLVVTLDNNSVGTGGYHGGDLITGADSAWTFNKDSQGNYGENNGTWNIGDYEVIFDNMTHTGTLNLSVNSDTGESGSIIVETATGDGTVHIDTTGNGQLNPNDVLPGLVSGDGTEHWQWDPIDWGIDTIIKDGDHFVKQGTSPAGAVLNSSMAIQQAMWFAQQNSLLKRMGDLRYGARASRPLAGGTPAFHNLIENIWLRSYGQQLNVGSQVAGKAYEQLIYGVDLGTDHKFTISADSDLYLGVYAGYGRSDLDYRTPGTDGEINSYYGGLYATWLHSSGFYIDATFKAASVDNDLKAPYGTTQLTANYSDVNIGGSIEIGKKFTFSDAWFIEPQFQVNYLHILAEDYHAGPMTINAQDLDALQLRIGSIFGRTINLTNSGALQPYVKISGVETISTGGTIRNGYQSTRANTDGARAELGAGLIWQLDANNQLHLDYEASFGDKYDKPWGLTAGYRHQF